MQLNILNLWQAKNFNKTIGGRYKIVKKLGEGGFGQTFVAEDIHLPGNPRCVVKQLKPQITDPASWQTARRLFDSEAKVLSQLGEHDQIPRLLAHFEENKEFYLAQELIEGESLSQELIAGQPWPETKVISFLQDLLSVLAFVHQQEVIHRDIKPENLIRRHSDGKIVLIDFGAVKQVSSQQIKSKSAPVTNLTISIGTHGYMPKEQLGGNPRYSSDVYAVGIIGIQALIGIHPRFWTEDSNTGEINWREYVAKSVSPQLVDVLDRMIRYDFRSRYANAGQALEALRKLPPRLLESLPAPQPWAKNTKIPSPGKSQLGTKVGTVVLQEQIGSHSSKGLQGVGTVWEGLIQNSPINQKQLLIGLSVVGVLFLAFKILPTLQSDPLSRAIDVVLKEGETARKEGNYPEALAAYDRAIAFKPDLAEPHWRRCLTLNLMQRYEEAIASCDRALKIQPKYPEALYSKGFALQKQQKYGEALDFYDQALAIDSKYPEAWKGKGLTLLALNARPKEALEAFDKAIAIKSEMAEAQWGRCYSLNMLGEYGQAVSACDRALKIQPKYSEAFYSKGFALEKQQKYSDALSAYNKALEINSNHTEAWNHKGLTLLALNNPPKDALEAFDRSLAIKQDQAEAHWGRCSTLNLMGQYESAIVSCDLALKIQPKYPEALYSKGFALEKQQKFPDALKLYDQALEINPKYTAALNRRGFTLIALNSPQEAVKTFDRELELKSDQGEGHWGRCFSLNLLGQYENAIHSCDRALGIKPKYPEALTSKGFALAQMNKHSEALKLYDDALKIDPNYAPAWNNKAVTLLAIRRDFKEVQQAYDKAIALNPNLAEAHWGRCFSLNSIGQYQSAIASCDRALELKPNYPQALWSKGYALDKQNNHSEALKLYEKALEIDPKYAEAWNNKGVTLLSLGSDAQNALDAFDRAVAIKPDFDQAWINRGATLWRLQRLDEAIASIEKGLQLNPENQTGKNLLIQARQQLRNSKR